MRPENVLVGSAPDKSSVRRINHGGFAWIASDRAENLHQPQDGAPELATVYNAITKKPMFREPDDARLTGGTRSLMRRVMGLNVTALAVARKVAPKAIVANPAHAA